MIERRDLRRLEPTEPVDRVQRIAALVTANARLVAIALRACVSKGTVEKRLELAGTGHE
jgi:hypothetical protein